MPALLTLRHRSPLLHPSRPSLVRGNVLVIASLAWALHLSHFPLNHPTLWLIVPLIGAILGTADTVRCMQPRWNFYHGGVLLCVYMDLMAGVIIVFALVYPYVYLFTSAR